MGRSPRSVAKNVPTFQCSTWNTATKKILKKCLTFRKFWRGGASSSTMTILYGVACAIISARAKFVKSFLRVRTKLFAICIVILAPARRLYSSRPTMSSTFYGKGANLPKGESSRGANYTVPRLSCQVLFTPNHKLFRLTSLRGCGKVVS